MTKAHKSRRAPPWRGRNPCSHWQIIIASLAIGIFGKIIAITHMYSLICSLMMYDRDPKNPTVF